MHEPNLHDIPLSAPPGSTLVSTDQQNIAAAELAMIAGKGEGLPPKKAGQAIARLMGIIRALTFQRQAMRDETGIEKAAFQRLEHKENSYWQQLGHHHHPKAPSDLAAIRNAAGAMHHVHDPLHEEIDEERLKVQNVLDWAG